VAPKVETGARARVRFSLDRYNNELRYHIKLTGMKPEEVLFTSIHRASKGENGPMLRLIRNDGYEEVNGTVVLSNVERQLLSEGRLYFQVSTTSHRSGAIRAQLILPSPD